MNPRRGLSRGRPAVLVACVVALGCGDGWRGGEIVRLRAALQDAERQLDEADRQARASTEEATRLARRLDAARKELTDTRSDADADVRRLRNQLVAVECELRAARDRGEAVGQGRDLTGELSPVGVWAQPSGMHRFLFLANGRGRFQTWDAGVERWCDGKRTASTMALSSGDFSYESTGVDGAYVLRYTEQRKRSPSGGPQAVEMADETRVVEVLFVMRSADDARLVGWSDDTVVRRVDDAWAPEVAGR